MYQTSFIKQSKTSFEENSFSAWASTLNMYLADVSSVSPSSEQTGDLCGNQCLNSW